MTDKEVLLRQIEQLRTTLIAVVAGLDTLAGSLDRVLPDPPTEIPEEIDGQCTHPMQYRIPCPAGGRNVHRFYCTRCRQEGGVEPRS